MSVSLLYSGVRAPPFTATRTRKNEKTISKNSLITSILLDSILFQQTFTSQSKKKGSTTSNNFQILNSFNNISDSNQQQHNPQSNPTLQINTKPLSKHVNTLSSIPISSKLTENKHIIQNQQE